MPRPKKLPNLSLADHLSKYEPSVLQKALVELDNSFIWTIFKAYLKVRQREFEVASLDFAGHTGKHQESAKASGYAQGIEDVADNLMEELNKLLSGMNGVIENPMPENEE